MSKLDVIVPLRDHQRFLLTPLTKFAFTQTSTINSKLFLEVEVILPFRYMKLQIRLKYRHLILHSDGSHEWEIVENSKNPL